MADQPKADPPHGMEGYDLGGQNDLGALSQEQQEQLNKHKVKTRLANEKYLREHPEVDCMVSNFLRDVFLQRPDDIREFAAVYFNNPNLPEEIETALQAKDNNYHDMKVLRHIHHESNS